MQVKLDPHSQSDSVQVSLKDSYAEYNRMLETITDDPSGLQDKLDTLRREFRKFGDNGYEYRIRQLRALKKGLTDMKDELCQAITKDLGRGEFYAYISEIFLCVTEIDHVIDNLKGWMKEKVVDTPLMCGPGKSSIVYEPRGVILVMGAWNYPYYTVLGPLSQVIAAGNCAMIKTSEVSPHCSIVLSKMLTRYLDPARFCVVQGKVNTAVKLSQLKFDMIVFTGSSSKGKLINQTAAKNLVPCLLELGGKSPAIVDVSADAQLAAKKIIFGKMPNLGQVCIAPDYILCHESKFEQFMEEFRDTLKTRYNNCSSSEESGKMVNEFHYNRICDLLGDCGGEIILGNKEIFQDRKLGVIVVKNPKIDSALMRDEIFGPIFPLITFKEIDEAI
mmetsp:Transcript_4428/g.7539  ORF Transcript_4428/g.7539 Transcript_4428/m.7539 type:complete len:389 (-) Transcript_4428:471-1637(-)